MSTKLFLGWGLLQVADRVVLRCQSTMNAGAGNKGLNILHTRMLLLLREHRFFLHSEYFRTSIPVYLLVFKFKYFISGFFKV